jgi:hypothetical protein
MAIAQEKDDPTEEDWKEVRRRIVAANRADPEAPHPLILFYDSFPAEGKKPPASAVAGLRKAYDLAPQDRGLRVKLGRQMLIDGNARDAKALLAPVAYDPHSGEMGRHMAAVVAAIDAGGAEAGLKAFHGRPAGAEEEGAEGSR